MFKLTSVIKNWVPGVWLTEESEKLFLFFWKKEGSIKFQGRKICFSIKSMNYFKVV